MYRLIILGFLGLLFVKYVAAQDGCPMRPRYKDTSHLQVVDSANIRVWYALNAVDIKDSKTYDDWHRLEISDGKSKYYSFSVYNCDSLTTSWLLANRGATNYPSWLGYCGKIDYWTEYSYSDIFKDFANNMLTEYSLMPKGVNQALQYSEEIPQQQWEIHNDTLTIAGFVCQKASCKFRGRNFEAWFAPDIPVNNGPWKFGGLPGLILKLYDTEKRYVFECTQVEYFTKKFPIMMYSFYKNYKNVDRLKLLNLQREVNENYASFSCIVYFKMVGNKPVEIPPPPRKVHYPLELE